MTERKQLKREPKMKAELYEMLAEAVRNTQPESKRPPKAKRAKNSEMSAATLAVSFRRPFGLLKQPMLCLCLRTFLDLKLDFFEQRHRF
jgi:hypothetical protein